MAFEIDSQDVVDYAAELASVSDATWDVILPFVNLIDSSGIGGVGGDAGATLRFVRILLAAHYATVPKRAKSGAAGPVTSEAAGAVRRSYGLVALAASDASLGMTAYGQQLLGLLRMSDAHGPLVV